MNVHFISSFTNPLCVGLFSSVDRSSDNPLWGIRHLIVEGSIDVTTFRYCDVGGIAARSTGNIHFCRFNGSIRVVLTDTSPNVAIYANAGGIVAKLSGNGTVAGCISNASFELDIKNQENPHLSTHKGQLVGYTTEEANVIVNYSAWYSNGDVEGIGSVTTPGKATVEHNNAFADISALNALLPDMNAAPSSPSLENSYIWQANPQGYPRLVKKE